MKKRFTITSIVLIFVSLLTVVLTNLFVVSNYNRKNAENELKDYIIMASEIYNGNNEQDIVNFFNPLEIRVTIIDKDGNVLIDTSGDIDENHLNRPEIINIGKCYLRHSSTLNKNYLYIACLDEENYIRLALPESSINSIMCQFIIYSFIVLLAVGTIALIIYNILLKSYTRPLKNEIKQLSSLIDEDVIVESNEIKVLSKTINDVEILISNKIKDIEEEKEKNSFIIEYMQQGFILIDENLNVLMINSKIELIFDTKKINVINKNYIYLIRNIDFQNTIKKCLETNSSQHYEFVLNDRFYVASIELFTNGEYIKSKNVGIYIYDDTLRHNTLKMKQDFFANASHELKSPLTTIIGYQQLIEQGIIDDEKEVQEAIKKTLGEAKRMNEMISDMLEISRLESEVVEKTSIIDIAEVIKDIIKSLKIVANKKNIKIKEELETFTMRINQTDAYHLFNNLLENAIKYGKINGYVLIKIKENKKQVIIEDNGIGIAKENQERVFERFYQVNKSRSKNNEGSGLGLSIVKKICVKNNIEINLTSELDVGTKIILTFK